MTKDWLEHLGHLVRSAGVRRGGKIAPRLHTTRLLTSLFLLFGAVAASEVAAQTGARPATRAQPADGPDAQPLPRRVAIRFLTDNDFPPFNYLDEDNQLTGFNVEIARALCLELAAACDIQARPWRLAFALSMAVDFDCFLIDEVIAVGDARFHDRCANELFEKRQDRTMVIVSHEPLYIQEHCDRATVLDNGHFHDFASVGGALAFYRACR